MRWWNTTIKAHVGAIVTAVGTYALLWINVHFGLVPVSTERLAESWSAIGLSIQNGIIAWLGIYFAPKNEA